jgi:hypothetical protein
MIHECDVLFRGLLLHPLQLHHAPLMPRPTENLFLCLCRILVDPLAFFELRVELVFARLGHDRFFLARTFGAE